jgi:hypothetical protein
MMATATAAMAKKKIGKETRGSLLPTYSMLLSLISGPLPPRGLNDSVTGLSDGGSGSLVGMVLDIKANGGFELSGTRITPGGRLSLFSI